MKRKWQRRLLTHIDLSMVAIVRTHFKHRSISFIDLISRQHEGAIATMRWRRCDSDGEVIHHDILKSEHRHHVIVQFINKSVGLWSDA